MHSQQHNIRLNETYDTNRRTFPENRPQQIHQSPQGFINYPNRLIQNEYQQRTENVQRVQYPLYQPIHHEMNVIPMQQQQQHQIRVIHPNNPQFAG